jgi:hypothetical protein
MQRSLGAKVLDFGHKAVVFGLVSFVSYTIFEVGSGVFHIIRLNRNGGIPMPPQATITEPEKTSTPK